jgi:hypothetical protein
MTPASGMARIRTDQSLECDDWPLSIDEDKAMDRSNERSSVWASATAVLTLTLVISLLYLPLFL